MANIIDKIRDSELLQKKKYDGNIFHISKAALGYQLEPELSVSSVHGKMRMILILMILVGFGRFWNYF